MFKTVKGTSPKVFSNSFKFSDQQTYDMNHSSQFNVFQVRSVYNGTESISFLGPKVKQMIPASTNEKSSLESFKAAIKK